MPLTSRWAPHVWDPPACERLVSCAWHMRYQLPWTDLMLALIHWYLTRKVNAWAWEAYVPIGQTITYMTKVLEHTCFHNIKRGQQIQQKCDYTANLHTQSRSIIPFLQLCATRPQGSSMGSTLTVACLNCKQGGK